MLAQRLQSAVYTALSIALIALFALLILVAPAFADDKPKPMATPTPDMQAVLDQLATLNGKPIEMLDAKDARKQPTPTDAVMALLKKEGKSTAPMAVGDVDNTSVEMDGLKVPVRVYYPNGAGPFPVIVYYHGGGFVIADLDTYDASCRELCDGVKAVVVSVAYRQAPENKFPAAVDDAWAAYDYVVHNAAKFKGDPTRIAVAGESAGGNLATVTCYNAITKGVALPVFQLLVYPVVDHDQTRESYVENANAKPLNKAMMGWFFNQYLATANSADDPRVSPIKIPADAMAKMPPAGIIAAEIDPLRSEGRAYYVALKKAGVKAYYKPYAGVTHEFFGMGVVVETAKHAENEACRELKIAFGMEKEDMHEGMDMKGEKDAKDHDMSEKK